MCIDTRTMLEIALSPETLLPVIVPTEGGHCRFNADGSDGGLSPPAFKALIAKHHDPRQETLQPWERRQTLGPFDVLVKSTDFETYDDACKGFGKLLEHILEDARKFCVAPCPNPYGIPMPSMVRLTQAKIDFFVKFLLNNVEVKAIVTGRAAA